MNVKTVFGFCVLISGGLLISACDIYPTFKNINDIQTTYNSFIDKNDKDGAKQYVEDVVESNLNYITRLEKRAEDLNREANELRKENMIIEAIAESTK